jgi:hypothetical protein
LLLFLFYRFETARIQAEKYLDLADEPHEIVRRILDRGKALRVSVLIKLEFRPNSADRVGVRLQGRSAFA